MSSQQHMQENIETFAENKPLSAEETAKKLQKKPDAKMFAS